MTRSYKHIEKYEEVKPSIKYNIIYRHKNKYAISVMCKFFNISRSGYYGYISRMNTPAWDLPLAEQARQCQEKCGKIYS